MDIQPLSKLHTKDKGVIAYLHTKNKSQVQKLMSIGVLPGMHISLLQRFPSYVFALGHSQFAVDKELAEAIYVRVAKR
jgi:DtxR family Mn-dependent transcriptional regulator